MLSKRIISAILGILFFYLIIEWGYFPFFILTTFIMVLGMKEYSFIIRKRFEINQYLFIFLGLIFIFYSYLINIEYINFPFPLILLFIVLTLFFYYITTKSYENIISIMSVNLLGIIYIAGGFSYLLFLKNFASPPLYYNRALWLTLFATWAADTGAYFTGKYFGKNKLAPNLSPNKTIEGAFGAIVFTCVVVIIFLFTINTFTFHILWLIYPVILAILSIIGDLFASALKRDFNIKDSGNIIPGHGGVLDRFDSLLFTLIFSYYFFNFII